VKGRHHLFAGNGLRAQLIVAIAGVHAVLMTLFVWDATTRQKVMMRQWQADQALAVTQTMATASAGWVAAKDVAGLQEIVEAQRRYPELVFAMVLDHDGLVLAHTDRAHLGEYVHDLPRTADGPVIVRTADRVDVAVPVQLAHRDIGWVRVGLGRRLADAQMARITRDGVLYALGAILLGVVFAAVLGTRLTARLHKMRDVSAAVRVGRRDARVPDLGTDEIGTLASDFNVMLDHLAAREAEIRLQSLALDVAANAIVITDREGRVLWVNRAFVAMTGYAREEAVGQKLGRLLNSGKQPEAFYQELWRIILSGQTWRGEILNRRRDGTLYIDETTIAPLTNERGEVTHFIAVKQDVTKRRESEAALRESEERFRQVVETITQVFWVTDGERQRMLYISPSYENIWGRPCASLYRSLDAWLETVHPDDRPRFAQVADRQRRGEYDETYRIVRPDGTLRWIHARAFPVRDAAGRVERIVGVADDVTEAKQFEEQLLRAQRLEAVGTLASGIAHDLNNILSPMVLVTGLLRANLPDPRDQELLQMIEKSAQRGASVIRQLLTFSRGTPGERVLLQLPHLVKEMVHIAQETFPRNIQMEAAIASDIWCVRADPTQLHQVLMNLCVNARDAMPDGGRLTIAVRNELVAPESPPPGVALPPGPYVVLSVSDTGIGIPKTIQHRIFEPFFTTKGVGSGTGLGLATVLGIVKGHGGAIALASEAGAGTTFTIHLPAEPAALASGGAAGAAEFLPGGGQLVLVVDDEPELRQTIRTLLERHGYRVATAFSGQDALLQVNLRPESFKAAITDLMMPQMDGVALIRVLRKTAPHLKLIATSGLGQHARTEELKALGIERVLAKPFAPEELLRLLERQLAGV